MKSLLVFISLIGLLVYTNPSKNIHKSEVKEFMYSEMNLSSELGNGGNEYETAGTALGLSLGMSLIDKFIDNIISIDNYVIFSTTSIIADGNSKVIGYGLLGNVFIFGEVKEHFRNSMRK